MTKGRSSPQQVTAHQWASKILEIMQVPVGGPIITETFDKKKPTQFCPTAVGRETAAAVPGGSPLQPVSAGPRVSAVPEDCVMPTEAPHPSTTTDQQAFPTDSKEREKIKDAANKAQGIEKVVKRKPKVIERHRDDCGDDLNGLKDTCVCP